MKIIDGGVPDSHDPNDTEFDSPDPAHTASLVLRGAKASDVSLRNVHQLADDLRAVASWIAASLGEVDQAELVGDDTQDFYDTTIGETITEAAALAQWQAESLRLAFESNPEALASRAHVVSARVWAIVDSW